MQPLPMNGRSARLKPGRPLALQGARKNGLPVYLCTGKPFSVEKHVYLLDKSDNLSYIIGVVIFHFMSKEARSPPMQCAHHMAFALAAASFAVREIFMDRLVVRIINPVNASW